MWWIIERAYTWRPKRDRLLYENLQENRNMRAAIDKLRVAVEAATRALEANAAQIRECAAHEGEVSALADQLTEKVKATEPFTPSGN